MPGEYMKFVVSYSLTLNGYMSVSARNKEEAIKKVEEADCELLARMGRKEHVQIFDVEPDHEDT